MEGLIRIDTHVAVWLYTADTDRFSAPAREAMESESLTFSPMVGLELTYLHEIGRLTVSGPEILADLAERVGLKPSDQTLAAVTAAANALTWTRDSFDRLIVGDALAANVRLLTKDRTILDNTQIAFW